MRFKDNTLKKLFFLKNVKDFEYFQAGQKILELSNNFLQSPNLN